MSGISDKRASNEAIRDVMYNGEKGASPSSLTMSSLEIAGLVGKQHAHVLRDADRMLEDLKLDQSKFGSMFLDKYGRQQRCLKLPKRECLILVSGYRLDLRARIIDRWIELEAALVQGSKPTGLTRDDVRDIAADVVKEVTPGIVREVIVSLVPILLEGHTARTQVAVVRGVTAGEVIRMAGFTDRRSTRGLAKMVSHRLRMFHDMQKVKAPTGSLGPSHARIFDPDVCRKWLASGGREFIDQRVKEKQGQGHLRLVGAAK